MNPVGTWRLIYRNFGQQKTAPKRGGFGIPFRGNLLVQRCDRQNNSELLTIDVKLAVLVRIDARGHVECRRSLFHSQFVVNVGPRGIFLAVAECDLNVGWIFRWVEQVIIVENHFR